MDIEKARQEYEAENSDRAWFVSGGKPDDIAPEGFVYDDFTTDMCWTCWVGSRKTLIIELPNVCVSDDPFVLKRDIIDELESLGLKVKP